MKWKNIDIGASYYYITGTFVEWLPMFRNADARMIICEEIMRALDKCGGVVSVFVLMPDHLHLLVYLPDDDMLHRFCRHWRGSSARRLIDLALDHGASRTLEIMARHANGKAQYAVWKEQVRSLPIWSQEKLYAMVNYIHSNPVRKGLVEHPGDWEFSSYRFYENGEAVALDVTPLIL